LIIWIGLPKVGGDEATQEKNLPTVLIAGKELPTVIFSKLENGKLSF
jgi:hypothetical protein